VEAADQAAEQLGARAGGGEGDADPFAGLDDAGADLDQAHLQRLELGDGERLRRGDVVADQQQQPVGLGDFVSLVTRQLVKGDKIRLTRATWNPRRLST
jgi:hypothetical protein